MSGAIANVADELTPTAPPTQERPGLLQALARRWGLPLVGLAVLGVLGWLFGGRRRG